MDDLQRNNFQERTLVRSPAQYCLSSGGVATTTSLLPKSRKAVMWKAMLEKTTRYSQRANSV
ncbi:hypothetical protein EYF80_054723 [Liparis tanakae]|uniref:Uncharacterized protein n=1 Tax=Liparis tanakae TaxID=230148 RepID=A0A4Z2F343_9TELE|nr:hypothetical protein EYF80_054723 [Liparis tanakae]